jgi:hypothetical protein
MKTISLILNIVLIVVLVNLIAIAGFLIYQNYPRAAEVLHVVNYNSAIPNIPVNASPEVVQFIPKMRFNHNKLSYFISKDCSEEKIQRMLEAFEIVTNKTEIIKFYSTKNEKGSDILIGCSSNSYETEKNVFIAGEGGPTSYINLSLYPVIARGKIILYNETSCKNNELPVTELHELFHVFGFDHINKTEDIMYSYVDCKQKINPELINMLVDLYSIEPLPELYFINITAIKTGIYLNFSVGIANDGLMDAENVSLEVYSGENKIDSFNLENIEFGTSTSFYVRNLKLPSFDTNKIDFNIILSQNEFNKNNNFAEVGV